MMLYAINAPPENSKPPARPQSVWSVLLERTPTMRAQPCATLAKQAGTRHFPPKSTACRVQKASTWNRRVNPRPRRAKAVPKAGTAMTLVLSSASRVHLENMCFELLRSQRKIVETAKWRPTTHSRVTAICAFHARLHEIQAHSSATDVIRARTATHLVIVSSAKLADTRTSAIVTSANCVLGDTMQKTLPWLKFRCRMDVSAALVVNLVTYKLPSMFMPDAKTALPAGTPMTKLSMYQRSPAYTAKSAREDGGAHNPVLQRSRCVQIAKPADTAKLTPPTRWMIAFRAMLDNFPKA